MNIGIDLGTTNTVVGWMNLFGNIEFLEFDENQITLPSCIYYDRGNIIVGRNAIKMSEDNPSAFICNSKIFMDDRSKCWTIEGRRFKAEDVAFEILKTVRKTLKERFPDEKIFNAVITVPAKFGEDQIKRTVSALKRAGIGLIEVLKEPVAAVLAYNDDIFKVNDRVYVVDFGGGTIDVAVIELSGNGCVTDFNVLSADGNRHLGGSDLDNVLSQIIFEQFKECSGQNISDEETTWGISRKQIRRKIQKAAQAAKKSLYYKNTSANEEIIISEPEACSICEKKDICENSNGFSISVSYDDYLTAADDIYDKVKELIVNKRVMTSDIQHVIFAGGMCTDPYMRQFIESSFPESNIIYASDTNTDEKYLTVIARGAAIKACDENIRIVNKLLNSLGIICVDSNGRHYMDPIISEGTDIDRHFESRHVYTNNGRFDTEMTFEIYEYNGDPNDFNNLEYRKIGSFTFNDITPMDIGKQRIETVFSFDSRGILSVMAVDLNDNKRNIEVFFQI